MYKAHQIRNDELTMLGDMKLNDFALDVKKDELIGTGEYIEFDIPKNRMTKKTIDYILEHYND